MSEIAELLNQARSLKGTENKDIDIVLRENLLKVNNLKKEINDLHNKKLTLMEDVQEREKELRLTKEKEDHMRVRQNNLKSDIKKQEIILEDNKRKAEEDKANISQEKELIRKQNEEILLEKENVKDQIKELAKKKKELDEKSLSMNEEKRKLYGMQEDLQKKTININKRTNDIIIKQKDLNFKTDEAARKKQTYEEMCKLLNKEREAFDIERSLIEKDKKNIESKKKELLRQEANLLIKKEEYDVETDKAKRKQASLDRNIEEMKNEYNRLEIVRLKIEKLIMDNNTIKDLEGLRKELHK